MQKLRTFFLGIWTLFQYNRNRIFTYAGWHPINRLYSDEFCGHSQGVGYGDGGNQKSLHELDDALKRTGKLFGGMINDIKRKKPFYWSDYTDGLNMQCVATVMFLYFAIITPIVTFGGLLADATHNNIAAIESMIGGMISGTLYHVFRSR